MSLRYPETHRIRRGRWTSNTGEAGAFRIPAQRGRSYCLNVIACSIDGWEHVSVSLNEDRTPTWEEMAYIKSVFWEEEDCVIQYHPPKSEYISNHDYCLHLWRREVEDFPLPPSIHVGIKGITSEEMSKMSEKQLLALVEKGL